MKSSANESPTSQEEHRSAQVISEVLDDAGAERAQRDVGGHFIPVSEVGRERL